MELPSSNINASYWRQQQQQDEDDGACDYGGGGGASIAMAAEVSTTNTPATASSQPACSTVSYSETSRLQVLSIRSSVLQYETEESLREACAAATMQQQAAIGSSGDGVVTTSSPAGSDIFVAGKTGVCEEQAPPPPPRRSSSSSSLTFSSSLEATAAAASEIASIVCTETTSSTQATGTTTTTDVSVMVEEEVQRLRALQSYHILPEDVMKCQRLVRKSLRQLVKATALALRASHCYVAVVDLGRVCVLASYWSGGSISSNNGQDDATIRRHHHQPAENDALPRAGSVALQTISSTEGFLQVENIAAAVPLVCESNRTCCCHKLGAIVACGGDDDNDMNKTFVLSNAQQEILKAMAASVMSSLEQHRDQDHVVVGTTRQYCNEESSSKNQIFASVAHDLRTPLTGMQLSLSLLESTAESFQDHQQRECLHTAVNCAKVMGDVCDRLCVPTTTSKPCDFVLQANIPIHTTAAGGTPAALPSSDMTSPGAALSSAKGVQVETARKRKRALVIDDSIVVRKSLARALGKMGYDEVVLAKDGQEGLEQLKANYTTGFDIALCDFLMPVMDGLDCVKQYRQYEQKMHHHQFIVGMSAHASSEDVDRGLKLGMDDFVQKPVFYQHLKDLLQSPPLKKVKTNTLVADTVEQSLGQHRPTLSKECYFPDMRVCLLASSSSEQVVRVTEITKESGWQCHVANSGNDALRSLKSRKWGAVLLDEHTLTSDDIDAFQKWERRNRVHRQKWMYLLSEDSKIKKQPEKCVSLELVDGECVDDHSIKILIQRIQQDGFAFRANDIITS